MIRALQYNDLLTHAYIYILRSYLLLLSLHEVVQMLVVLSLLNLAKTVIYTKLIRAM